MVDYEKLYHFLVGKVDDTLQLICYDLLKGQHGEFEFRQVANSLRAALMEAEEMYLNQSEEAYEKEEA